MITNKQSAFVSTSNSKVIDHFNYIRLYKTWLASCYKSNGIS